MSDAKQMKDALGPVNVINHAIISDPQSEGFDAFHSTMRMGIEGHTQTVNGGFNPGLNRGGQLEEVGIEIARVDLKRRAHSPTLGSRVRE